MKVVITLSLEKIENSNRNSIFTSDHRKKNSFAVMMALYYDVHES